MARKATSEPEATKSARTKGKFTAADPGECDDGSKGGHVKIPTVGICASAGGLEAFKGFFAAMPPDSGVAFVLIPHLDPHHESLMAELVGRYTKMPVVEAANQMPIRPNHVYVLPPNAYMTLVDGKLRVTGPVERGGLQTSIDLFLRSLATDQQEKAIGIILSGTGSHGSLGLKAIKECDGMTMVQDPKTAQYPRMPESAIATGMADFVLPVEKMPAALVAYVRSAHVKHPPAELAIAEPPETLDQIMALLRSQTRFDFRPYRKKMVQRRIARRMGLRQLSKLIDYLEYLNRHPEEVKLLYHDLLIGVTSFFRDPEIFQTFETDALAPLVRSKKPDEPLRVWSAGCATGEEAYSVAMAIFEQMAAEKSSCQPQIFATDVDETAIEIARQGKYPESIRTDVSAERLGRFFTLTDDTYQVNKKLREVVSFARQNLIADAPFSKLDVIVCRNLLIYLEPEIQQKVIRLFHFSLKQGGILFLGSSETIGRETDLFAPVSKKCRIFRRKGPVRPERVEMPIAAINRFMTTPRRTAPPVSTQVVNFADLTHRLLLEQFAPASVLINVKLEVLHLFGATDRYLTMPAGKPTHDLMLLVRPGLRANLRSAIRKAASDAAAVTLANAHVESNGVQHPLLVTIRPVREPQCEDLFLITFQDSTERRSAVPPVSPDEESLVRQLESELQTTQEDLQSTIEEMEAANEELKVSNEEVMSMNEELQSTNEELETSKEEMQSLNEELSTVNVQLQEKIEELEAANSDVANLLRCSDVAIIFLDTHFRIKRFTPLVTRLFKLIASDLGRDFSDIAPKFTDANLQEDMEGVLRTLSPHDKQVQAADGSWWSRRITPYQTPDNRVEGVTITFHDVTRLKVADAQAQRLAAITMDSNDAIIVHDMNGTINAWNRGAHEMFGYSEFEAIGKNVSMLDPDAGSLTRSKGPHAIPSRSWETQRRTKDGRILDVWVTATILKGAHGEIVAIAKTERDITARKELERDVVEIASLEQRRIGQDMHDTVGQELTALNLLVGDLADVIRSNRTGAVKLVKQIIQGLQRVRNDLRTVLRGLLPVAIESDGLTAALSDLADRVRQEHSLDCAFESQDSVALPESSMATHLYLIAQEAVRNAIQHAQPKRIRISLKVGDYLVLQIEDDGMGMPTHTSENHGGLGLRIMRNRAAVIGATLTVHSNLPRGTLVTCALSRATS